VSEATLANFSLKWAKSILNISIPKFKMMKIWEMDYRIQFSKVSVVKRAALLVNCEFEIIPPLSLLGMDNNELLHGTKSLTLLTPGL